MSGRYLVTAFWGAMRANDWEKAAGYPGAGVCHRLAMFRGTDRRAERLHRSAGPVPDTHRSWTFHVHRLVSDGGTVVSEVTVTDGEQSARVVAFSEIEGQRVVRQVEYWPGAYDPPPGREHLTRPTERIP